MGEERSSVLFHQSSSSRVFVNSAQGARAQVDLLGDDGGGDRAREGRSPARGSDGERRAPGGERHDHSRTPHPGKVPAGLARRVEVPPDWQVVNSTLRSLSLCVWDGERCYHLRPLLFSTESFSKSPPSSMFCPFPDPPKLSASWGLLIGPFRLSSYRIAKPFRRFKGGGGMKPYWHLRAILPRL